MKIDIKNIFGITTGGNSADHLDVKQVIEGPEPEEGIPEEGTSETPKERTESSSESMAEQTLPDEEVERIERSEGIETSGEVRSAEDPEKTPDVTGDAEEELETSAGTDDPEEAGDESLEEETSEEAGDESSEEAEEPEAPEASETPEEPGSSEEAPEEESDEASEVIEKPEEPEASEKDEKPEEEADDSEVLDDPEVPEASEASESPVEEAGTPRQKIFPTKEKLLAWGKSYGWMTGIAAAFVVLMAFLVIYTTMIPRDIKATINGEELRFTTEAYTVEAFLREEGITICDEDYISVPLTAFIQDGLSFELNHATEFTVTADGKTRLCKTLDNTVEQALDDVGIKIGKLDIVTPGLDTRLKDDMRITIQRVAIKKETVEEKIAFKTVNQDDTSMDEGTTKVVTKGKDGTDKVTYEITYVDGKETARKEVARETVEAVVDEVVSIGTRVNYNGQTYSRKLVVRAYAYTGGGITAMGTRARVGEIAVDPSVIPLGTNVYIEGVGPRRAEDTGGNIQGNTIDIYMATQAECLSWGVRYVTIYIQ